LIGEAIFFILFEQSLKRAFGMWLEGCCKFPGLCQRSDERGLANAAGTHNADEFVH
jgi:hypothetical protein